MSTYFHEAMEQGLPAKYGAVKRREASVVSSPEKLRSQGPTLSLSLHSAGACPEQQWTNACLKLSLKAEKKENSSWHESHEG